MTDFKYRKNVRIPKFDYSVNGYYFVTICTALFRKRLRGAYADMVENELSALEKRFPGAKAHTQVIMDDHVHVIIGLQDCQTPLPDIVGALKSLTTRRAKAMGYSEKQFWQPNYHEHVIRDSDEHAKIIQYIIDNPVVRQVKMEEVRRWRKQEMEKGFNMPKEITPDESNP